MLIPRQSALLPPKQASSQEGGTSQATSTSSPQTVISQVVSSQAVSSSQAGSTDPQVVSTSASQVGSPWKIALLSQPVLLPRELALLYPRHPKLAGSPLLPGISKRQLTEMGPKWVINLSSKSLSQAQRSVLAKGPNFAVTPRHPPNLEYIMTIEAACTKLGHQDAKELRAEISRVLRSSHLQT